MLQRELHKEKPWGRWRPVRFKTQRTVWPVCKERGRMKGEEVARGPTVQALYQARLRTLLFSLRLFCFLATILGMGRRDGSEGCQVEGGQVESGVSDSGGDYGGSL